MGICFLAAPIIIIINNVIIGYCLKFIKRKRVFVFFVSGYTNKINCLLKALYFKKNYLVNKNSKFGAGN